MAAREKCGHTHSPSQKGGPATEREKRDAKAKLHGRVGARGAQRTVDDVLPQP